MEAHQDWHELSDDERARLALEWTEAHAAREREAGEAFALVPEAKIERLERDARHVRDQLAGLVVEVRGIVEVLAAHNPRRHG